MSHTVTKKDYTIAVAQKLGINLSQAHTIVTDIFNNIRSNLEQGYELLFHHFGRIVFRTRAAHKINNLQDPSKPATSPLRIRLAFIPSKRLKNLTTRDNIALFSLPLPL